MLEEIAVGLMVHFGKRLIDRVWDDAKSGKQTLVSKGGADSHALANDERTRVDRASTVTVGQAFATVIGDFYLSPSVDYLCDGNEITLVVVTEEKTQEQYLFPVYVRDGYEIDLPSGLYSFVTLILDGSEEDIANAKLFAVGYPTTLDLSDIYEVRLEDGANIDEIVSTDPIKIDAVGEPVYQLPIVLLGSEALPDVPAGIFGFMADDEELADAEQPAFDLTGTWELKEIHEHGAAVATMYVVQMGHRITSTLMRYDIMDDDSELMTQELVVGTLIGDQLDLAGVEVRILEGNVDDYYLDRYEGLAESNWRVCGYSNDEGGTVGHFMMDRTE
jgi:hypothetical protein